MKPFLPRLLLPALIAAAPLAAQAAAPSPGARAEITHLVDYLKNSGCQFQRNGSWYDSAKAAEHLRGKYDYLLKKGWVATAEDFITRAATESSISRKPYQVRCAQAAAQPSADWLQAELQRLRAPK